MMIIKTSIGCGFLGLKINVASHTSIAEVHQKMFSQCKLNFLPELQMIVMHGKNLF